MAEGAFRCSLYLSPNYLLAAAHLPWEGSSSSQASALLPSGEGSNSSQATALLPPREGSSNPQAVAVLSSGESGNSSQATALLPPNEGSSNPQAGQSNNPRSVRQGCRHSPRHRATQSSQENSTISWDDTSAIPPVAPPKVLPMKNLTLSGSLTFPANP